MKKVLTLLRRLKNLSRLKSYKVEVMNSITNEVARVERIKEEGIVPALISASQFNTTNEYAGRVVEEK